jgi:hypothetical protein
MRHIRMPPQLQAQNQPRELVLIFHDHYRQNKHTVLETLMISLPWTEDSDGIGA